MWLWLIVGAVAVVFMLTALTGAPYVPTHRQQARAAFTVLRPLTSRDTVLDIGSGDGVVLQEAIRAGAHAVVGYEINPFLVGISWLRLRRTPGAQVRWRDFWRATLPAGVTVFYTFGESRDIAKMYQLAQHYATRYQHSVDFISYGFPVPGKTAVRTHNAHYLYRIAPLQSSKHKYNK